MHYRLFGLFLLLPNLAYSASLPTLESFTSVNNSNVLFWSLLVAILMGSGLVFLGIQVKRLKQHYELQQQDLNAKDAILQSIPEVLCEMDITGRYISVWTSHEANNMLDETLTEAETVFDVMPPQQAEILIDALNEADAKGISQGHQVNIAEKGKDKWFEFSVRVKNEQVEPHEFIVLTRDITEKKLIQQKLTQSQQRFQGLFENMANGVSIFKQIDNGRDYIFIEFNRAAEEMVGISRIDVIGQPLSKVFKHVENSALHKVFNSVRMSGKLAQFPLKKYSGEELIAWHNYSVYKLATGEIVATFSDETKEKLATQRLQETEKRQKLILQSIPDLIWLKDLKGSYLTCNPMLERFFGAEEEDIRGKTDYDFVDQELADFFREHDQAAIKADKPQVNEEWINFADNGQRVLLETTKTPIKSVEGKVIGVLGVGHDITERYLSDEAKNLSASVFSHSHESILITDNDNKIIDVNPACLSLTGYSRDELIGQNPAIFSSGLHPEAFYTRMWDELEEYGTWDGEIQNRKKNGDLFTGKLTIDKVKNDQGKLTHYVSVLIDITYLKQQEKELERVAYSDPLTGLPNRLLLHDRMQQAISHAKRRKMLVAICYLDLDGFKPVNDDFGHEAGDEILLEVSRRMLKWVRSDDTVARLGGDEFVMLIGNLENLYELEEIISRQLDAISRPHILSTGEQVKVSASIGISLYPVDDVEPDKLLRHADMAMYESKKKGKNCYSFFDNRENNKEKQKLKLKNDILNSIKNRDFFLLYQPEVNMQTGETVGVEALLRWAHPEKGILRPKDFLLSIEHHPHILELGKWVIRSVLKQLGEWKKVGIGLNVSINIAAFQLFQHDFVSELKQMLGEFPSVSPTQIKLEIQESSVLLDIEHMNQVMQECNELGIQFTLDDFGSGFSSLSYLKQIPARTLKIDHSFVSRLGQDIQEISLIEGIINLVHAIQRTPIATGIETVEQGNLLINMGCEIGQGFYIAKPMKADEIPQWIRQYKAEPEWLVQNMIELN